MRIGRTTPFGRALTRGVAGLAVCVLGGCAIDPPGPRWKGGTWGEHPFGPTTLRVHPLTHMDDAIVGRGEETPPLIVLHVELKDRYGDTVKGLGTMVATLYRGTPTGAGGGDAGMAASESIQQTRWEIPGMDDPDENARQFDPATRTYRIQLEAPAWMEAATRDGSRPRLRVVLDLGGGNTLSDEWGVRK